MTNATHPEDQIDPAASKPAPEETVFAKARRAYVTWLKSMPADTFAPATFDEVLALYDKNCDPDWAEGRQVDAQAAHVAVSPLLDLATLDLGQWSRLVAQSSTTGGKTLTAHYRGDERAYFVVEDLDGSDVASRVLYKGYSLAAATESYNSGLSAAELPTPAGITVPDLIARSESIPGRKAALDRARVRRALASIQHAAIKALSPEAAVAELCKTPEGLAQYKAITERAPGTPYSPLRLDSGLTVEEVIVDLINTPEGEEEFRRAGAEMRAAFGIAGTGQEMMTSVAKAALFLLRHARQSLAGGLETDGELEAEWSKEDRALVARIDAVLANHLAKALLLDM